MLNRLVSTRRSGWQEKVFFNGDRIRVTDLVAHYDHVCQYDGNARDGWFVFLRDANGIGISISPCFGPDTGDTLRDLKAAFARMYGDEIKLTRGRNFW